MSNSRSNSGPSSGSSGGQHEAASGRGYALTLAGIAGLGAFARLWQLDGQIVGGDEWHAVIAAIGRSYAHIATHFGQADYSIPLTLFYKLLLDTVGLSEWGLHVVQACVGSLAVVVMPLLVRRAVGARASLVFAALIAISPLLVLYSRFARPYVLVAALGFVALWACARWQQSGSWRHGLGFAALTASVSWMSPVALPGLLAPLGFRIVESLWARWRSVALEGASLGSALVLLASTLLGIAAWLWPSRESLSVIGGKVASGRIETTTLLDGLEIFSGSAHPLAALAVVACVALGVRGLGRGSPGLATVLFVSVLAQYLALAVASPYKVSVGLVLARYSIVSLPPLLLACAVGATDAVDAAGRRAPRWLAAAALPVLLASLVAAGPLPGLLLRTNSFLGHPEFMKSWDHTGQGIAEEIVPGVPRFYTHLADTPGQEAVIEFPQVLWWSGTFYHRYQALHGRPVRMGHPAGSLLVPGQVMHPRLAFANSVDVDHPAALRASGARYLVVHKDPANEALLLEHLDRGGTADDLHLPPPGEHAFDSRYGARTRAAAVRVARKLRSLGVPLHYEDGWIAVFDLGGPGSPARGAEPAASGSEAFAG